MCARHTLLLDSSCRSGVATMLLSVPDSVASRGINNDYLAQQSLHRRLTSSVKTRGCL